MRKENSIGPIDEAFRILYLEQSDQDQEHALFHDPIYQLHKLSLSAKLSEEKKVLLFDKLFQRVETVPTLGLVLRERIEEAKGDLAQLSNQIKIPLEKLNRLLGDSIIPNSVPVRLMKELLVRLNIPFELAEKAIFNTFVVQLGKKLPEASAEKIASVAYRKESTSISSEMKFRSDADPGALFANEVALRKYLIRLSELFKEDNDVKN